MSKITWNDIVAVILSLSNNPMDYRDEITPLAEQIYNLISKEHRETPYNTIVRNLNEREKKDKFFVHADRDSKWRLNCGESCSDEERKEYVQKDISPKKYAKIIGLMDSIEFFKKNNLHRPDNPISFASVENIHSEPVEVNTPAIASEPEPENIPNPIPPINYNQIFTGVPGTGKTYKARHIAEEIVEQENGDAKTQIEFVQFHPSYDYTDFVEGLRPTKPDANGNIGFSRQDGIFKQFCKKALSAPDKHFFFIIDEINRGDISKIFGEIFFAIDPGYRGPQGRIKTQYSTLLEDDDEFVDGFFVPENVYIIGTMNDIDRSVESMDFAIRRRFQWSEIKAADAKSDIFRKIMHQYRTQADLHFVRLNTAIDNCQVLGPSFEIGPAYFLSLNDVNGDFSILWEKHIGPLVKEYLRGIPDAEEALNAIKDAFFAESQE